MEGFVFEALLFGHCHIPEVFELFASNAIVYLFRLGSNLRLALARR